jgi:hypothetical protein
MQSTEQEMRPEGSRSSDYLRGNSKKGNLPCGARYCFRCHEECGVIVNAYILRDIAGESSADDASRVTRHAP